MEDVNELDQKINESIKKNEEEQRRNAEKFTSDVNKQVNDDLESQLKNLYDHLPKDYLEKMKAQEDIIMKKGQDIEQMGETEAAKIKSNVQKMIDSSSH
ncbi:hypothetical protein GKC56_07125 [Neisseriaceae bacterium PsAf]|nr:hypothetical protein [Neisseriaceae bacterium PsAf]MCV2503802.1 hypothetical protein [Neisseriaceae bacterium]